MIMKRFILVYNYTIPFNFERIDPMIYKNMDALIGNTPLITLSNYVKAENLDISLVGKLEAANPGGSVKDRLARALLDDAEKKGLITRETTIIEPTSGNTGIGLAALAAARGYRLILTMPETMSVERRNLLKAFGAELVLTEGAKGMTGAVNKANELLEATPNAFIPGQFTNMANPQMHYATTGPEIWEDTNGKIDIFVAGVGTGGTISGVGKFLREKNANIQIIAVEPAASPMLSQGKAGPHKIQGIGAGFKPDVLDDKIYDEIITVTDADAFQTSKKLAQLEGILLGASSGAAVWASTQLARHAENAGKQIICVLPDKGERYLSMEIFS